MAKEKNNEVLMTEGNIWKQILIFSIPLLIGNLFQQLYNTVDSIVVGQCIGKNALAAVGSSNSLINLLIGVFSGIATGAGVIIAQYYGAKKDQKLEWAVHTAVCISFLGGVFMSVFGFFASGVILRWMGTPPEVMPNSVLYLRIFFLGSIFNLVYNMCAGILRAVGDSKSPLYYLCIASVTNIVLDLLLVVVFRIGVAGVGIATISSQAISMVLVLRKLMRSEGVYKLSLKKLKIDGIMAKRIIAFGVPSGLQSSIISLSNVIIQSNINSFGGDAMAGCSSFLKIDGFIMLPVMSFSMAIMTFIGQNIGAGKKERVKKGLYVTLLLTTIYVGTVATLLLIFGKYVIGVFSDEAVVVENGLIMNSILMPFYIIVAILNILTGAIRGAGKSFASMVLMIANLCGVRMLWVAVMRPIIPQLETVLWGYPVSWITGLLCAVLYIWKGNWMDEKLVRSKM